MERRSSRYAAAAAADSSSSSSFRSPGCMHSWRGALIDDTNTRSPKVFLVLFVVVLIKLCDWLVSPPCACSRIVVAREQFRSLFYVVVAAAAVVGGFTVPFVGLIWGLHNCSLSLLHSLEIGPRL